MDGDCGGTSVNILKFTLEGEVVEEAAVVVIEEASENYEVELDCSAQDSSDNDNNLLCT